MDIEINGKHVEAKEALTLGHLLRNEGFSGVGQAVAVEGRVVPRAAWDATPLKDGKKVTVIRAECGGCAMGSMKLIAITPPYFYRGEAQAIERALTADGGYARVHIRKPDATESEMCALIDAIDPALRPRLTLHDCLSLAPELGAGGVHLNSRTQSAPEGWSGLVSRSTHSLAEAQEAAATGLYSYIFLSPVYPSISKPGYFPPFTLDDLRGRLPRGIYALGGVTRSRLDALEAAGFEGAAMRGAAWRREIDPEAFSLQFITHGDTPDEVAQGALAAVEASLRRVAGGFRAEQVYVFPLAGFGGGFCRRLFWRRLLSNFFCHMFFLFYCCSSHACGNRTIPT